MTAKKPVPSKGPVAGAPVKATKAAVAEPARKTAKPALKPAASAVEALKGKAGRKPVKVDDKSKKADGSV